MVISGPCLPFRQPLRGRDIGLVERHQRSQPGTRALGHLAVLLARPAEAPAKIGATAIQQLMGQDQPLVGAQRSDVQLYTTQIVAQHDLALDLRAAVDDRYLILIAERDRSLQRRLHGTASCDRTPAVMYARFETKLERVCDVQSARICASLLRVREQLERRHAVAILQVLAAQPVAMGPQQHLALGARHDRDFLDQIAGANARQGAPSGAPFLRLGLGSGRHMGMSRPVASRPPLQFAAVAVALSAIRGAASA